MTDQWVRNSEGFALFYSVTSRDTFDRAHALYDLIVRIKDYDSDHKTPIGINLIPFSDIYFSSHRSLCLVVIGNKCDLETQREVPTSEGAVWAASIGAPFYESSALTLINIRQPFAHLLRLYDEKLCHKMVYVRD